MEVSKVRTSYERRVQDIQYLRQCITELEEIAIELSMVIKNNGMELPLMGKGIAGDDFLTPYNQGYFYQILTGDQPRDKKCTLDDFSNGSYNKIS